MSCNCICMKGTVVVGLIAALTPGLWAQSLQEQQTDGPRSLSEVQPTATPLRAMRGDKVSPGIGTNAPPALPAGGELMWFTNQATFEAFVQAQGKFLKGIEDFEESILSPNNVDAFDDPLLSGVANSPDGFPFPVGMTGLPDLRVQSNFEHDLFNENPRGVNGLGASSAGLLGGVSDIVVPNTIFDSLDLIFTGGKSGVGFNTISFNGANAVEVNVFSTTNVLLGEMASPADPTGANFIGVWSPTLIGRINIFDVGDGFEGGDNIQAWQLGPFCGNPDAGSCFEEHATPFCNDVECCTIVCAIDPFCCQNSWDGQCVGEAQEFCAGCGDPDAGSCFENNGTPGCNDPECCAIVCDADPFCCKVFWDGLCADEAADLCGLPPKNDLCENAILLKVPDFVTGITNDATVDDTFPTCDVTITAPGVWYSVIGTGATMTATTCSEFTEYNTKISVYCNTCGAPTCVAGNDDDCDMFGGLHSTVTWCSQAGAEYLILVHGFGDLTGSFDLSVFDDGVACAGPVDCADGGCGAADAGSCFEEHATPFCDDAECCAIVCAVDPFCCDSAWDEFCVDEAQELCAGCGDPDAGSCFENNGTPGCDDAKCCAIVCDADPFCCKVFWDGLCADEAAALCTVVSPKNDLCENAIRLKVPDFAVGFTNDATIDDSFPTCDVTITAPGIWYSVMGTGNTMTATTCSEFTEYNTKLSVYCNTCGDPTCVAGNDDDCDLFGGLHSTVTWCSQKGAEYLILVHGFGAATGGFELIVFDDGVGCAGPVDCLPPNPCPWDLDGSGSVGAVDLLELLFSWGPCPGCAADFNGDDIVGASDLLAMLFNWGPCPGVAECDGQPCGNYRFDCNPNDDTCICVTGPDGNHACVEGSVMCAGLEPCVNGDCPPGFRCAIMNCCPEDAICVPECDGVPNALPPPGTLTPSGIW